MIMPYYSDDNIILYNGDCNIILSNINDNFADVVITDPPFGINYQNNYTHVIKNKLIGDCDKFSYYNWSNEAYRILKNNTSIFAYTGWSEYPHHYYEMQKSGFSIKEPLIVQKRPSGTSDLYGSFQTNSDWLIFAHKGRFKFKKTNLLKNKKAGVIPNKGRKPVPEFKTRFPSCWFGNEFPWSSENPASISHLNHPTIKNLEFIKWLILLTTNENDLIIDPFCGSGTTLLAAKLTNRRAIGIEIEENFCKIARGRIKELL